LPSPPEQHRRPYIDRARGVAVLIMILAHATDAWTRNADRGTVSFRHLAILGGFAAPLFLWLAGLALVLQAERSAGRSGSRRIATLTIVRRGLEIFVLAFVFRLQAFVVSPGSPLVSIFRVDILNIMGPAIAAAGVAWGVARGARRAALMCGAIAAVIGLATPVVRSAAWVDAVPLWVQWHLRPAGDLTMFTLFPWAGFVFAGAAAGSLLSVARDRAVEQRVMIGLASGGAALVAGGFVAAMLPSIYETSSFWTSSPTYFAIRVGIVMLALAVVFAAAPAGPAAAPWRVLERFGRGSLFIYWIHVELVYGYLTWPIHGRLPIWAVLTSYIAFCALMYGALHLRNLATVQRRSPSRGAGAAVPV
jgi:uncharacterized membrane protein